MGFFSKLFGKKETPKEFTEEEWNTYYDDKQKGLENVLGKMHDMVGHAIIPFEVGGTLDMYYFINGIPGTGFATMELIKPDGSGPIPNKLGTYELVSFTKEAYDSSSADTPFNRIQGRLNGILTAIANYASQAKLQPKETAELPGEEGQPNYCLLFDDYKPNEQEFKIGDRTHGLLLVMEIFKDEMDFAMENGSAKLIEKLKAKGHYPYSDLNRASVLK
ncbi:suppressor of fused domain protein [Chryseolinea soli]|uniref:Uncharacterized protein n=1 Tax=Chryseolinea soli TaxID=2321403 RepID=A0A385SUT4_9BACT|nr:suppressor of fused domain protein [Chryseolinea soli]AYB34061.1 hypothetical protein D4L85_27315 [Chryseolinea soli]